MSTDNTITKTDLKNILEEIGNIGGSGDATPTPTANATAAFDSSAHMNSEDMTSSEVEDFVEDLDIGASGLLNMFYPVGSIYQTVDDGFNPNTRWGGTWELIEEGRFLQATETSQTGGDEVDAGLPNIEGHYKTGWADKSGGGIITPTGNSENNNGPFSNYHQGTAFFFGGSSLTESTDNYHSNYLNFDASDANSIYGNSTTVQPPSVKVYMWYRTA